MAYKVKTASYREFEALKRAGTTSRVVVEGEGRATFSYDSKDDAQTAVDTRREVAMSEILATEARKAREAFETLESYLEGNFGPSMQEVLGPIRATLDEMEDTMFGNQKLVSNPENTVFCPRG